MTTNRRTRFRLGHLVVALTAAMTLLAAACGTDDTTTEASASPLAEFLGEADFFSDDEAAQARITEEERARQEIIAACMQREGFEYTPVDYSQLDVFDDELDDYGSDEWVAEWGFGITTQRFSQTQVGPDLKGWDDEGMLDAEDDFVDPNQEYVESLGEQEQQAWYEALYGDDDDFGAFDESMSEEEMEAQFEDFAFEPGGCEGEAYNEDSNMAFYMEFEDELEEMEKRFEADPRVAERRQEVTNCVSDRGLDYTDMDSIYDRFEDDLQSMDPWANGFEPDFGVTEEEMAEMSPEELDELFSTPIPMPELSDDDKAKLGELQAEELALAVAVNECGGGFEAEYELTADLRVEYEREFLDTYADQLEEYKAG